MRNNLKLCIGLGSAAGVGLVGVVEYSFATYVISVIPGFPFLRCGESISRENWRGPKALLIALIFLVPTRSIAQVSDAFRPGRLGAPVANIAGSLLSANIFAVDAEALGDKEGSAILTVFYNGLAAPNAPLFDGNGTIIDGSAVELDAPPASSSSFAGQASVAIKRPTR